jgi:hypothetical protein
LARCFPKIKRIKIVCKFLEMGVIHEKNTKESCNKSIQREKKKRSRIIEIHEKGELHEEHAKKKRETRTEVIPEHFH